MLSSWKDVGSSLGLCLRRLRALLGKVDPAARVEDSVKQELFDGVKEVMERRCRLDQVQQPTRSGIASPSRVSAKRSGLVNI